MVGSSNAIYMCCWIVALWSLVPKEASKCKREFLHRVGVFVRCGASECTALPLKWSGALGQSPGIFLVNMEVVQCGVATVFYGITQAPCSFILAKSTLLLPSPCNTFRVFVFMLWSSCLLTACQSLSCCIGRLMKKPTMPSSSDVCAEVWCAWHSRCIIALQFHWMSQYLCHNWHMSSLLVAFPIMELMLPNGVLTLNATLHKPAHEQANHAFFLWVCAEVWCA